MTLFWQMAVAKTLNFQATEVREYRIIYVPVDNPLLDDECN